MTDRSLAPSFRRALGAAALFAAALVLPLSVAAPANAHSTLIGTSPETEGTVEQLPDEVSLTFSDDLIAPASPGDGTTDIVVYDETCEDAALLVANPGEADTRDCHDYADGDPVVEGPTATQALDASDAPAGLFTVVWRVLYADGHADSQFFTFTAETAAGGEGSTAEPTPAPGEETGEDATGAPAPSEEETASPAPEAADEESSPLPWVVGIGTAVVVIAAAGIAWGMIRRRGRRPGA